MPPELKFWGWAPFEAGRRIPAHRHGYFQSNWVRDGLLAIRTERRRHLLRAGELIFLPPGTLHSLEYLESGHCFSFKFFAPETLDAPVTLAAPAAIAAMTTLVEGDFPPALIGVPEGAVVMPGDSYAHLAEALLGGVLTLALGVEPHPGKLAGKVRELLRETGGRPLSAAAAARHCGYSRNHFSLLLNAETGLGAKAFIDRERLTMAQRYLTCSTLNIAEIAAKLGFSSEFYFSAFFRRLLGISPRRYRDEPTARK